MPKLDGFSKNIILVFAAIALLNFLNLACQLVIAHRLTAADFAAFNSLLSIFLIISAPFSTLQSAVAKYTSEYAAIKDSKKAKAFFWDIFQITVIASIVILSVFCLAAPLIAGKLKVDNLLSVYILAFLLASSCLLPVLSGTIQGREQFSWFSWVSVAGGVIKLSLVIIFINLGYGISGALGGFLAAVLVALFLFIFPLKSFFSLRTETKALNLKEFFVYLLPVGLSFICYNTLVSADMVMVKYYFNPELAGVYALSQMAGKIFLFLPGAISIVMFPRTSGLHAKNEDTQSTLKHSLFYAFVLCLAAAVFYNLWPGFSLNLLTGKSTFESIALGRLFSFSMSFFALSFVLITYFLSKKDFRFIPWLVIVAVLEVVAISIFRMNLYAVQLAVCACSYALFVIQVALILNHNTVKNERH